MNPTSSQVSSTNGLQIVDQLTDDQPCIRCGNMITDLERHTALNIAKNTARTRRELCRCNKCEILFVQHFDLFDQNTGHIREWVFSGDPNDPSYDWRSQLTVEQKKEVEDHLKGCSSCSKAINDDILSAIIFGRFLKAARKVQYR